MYNRIGRGVPKEEDQERETVEKNIEKDTRLRASIIGTLTDGRNISRNRVHY